MNIFSIAITESNYSICVLLLFVHPVPLVLTDINGDSTFLQKDIIFQILAPTLE